MADIPTTLQFTAFADTTCIAQGDLSSVATLVKRASLATPKASLLVFNDHDGRQVELDLRGSLAEVLQRLPTHPCVAAAQATLNTSEAALDACTEPATESTRRPGRPRLGVVPREVTLLPRHWDWLNTQPGGASVALRKLVEDARRHSQNTDQARLAIEASYRFMQAMAGNAPGFEEASRALFAADTASLHAHCAAWPEDVRGYMLRLAEPALNPLASLRPASPTPQAAP
jgi:hypothetical protein